MQRTVAFDVYGTLVDPLLISRDLEGLVGDDAARFAVAWREKQFEYLFRRGLGRRYEPFSVCTRQALDFVCLSLDHEIDNKDRDALMRRYRELPAFPDARPALDALQRAGFRNFAFSNGEPDDLAALLAHAGLTETLQGIVSAVDVRSFKPDPSVYGHFLETTGAVLGATWLVSANAFDVIGALETGWKAIWVRRNPSLHFDPWGVEPTATVSTLAELLDVLE